MSTQQQSINLLEQEKDSLKDKARAMGWNEDKRIFNYLSTLKFFINHEDFTIHSSKN